jgi:hypothetical protein
MLVVVMRMIITITLGALPRCGVKSCRPDQACDHHGSARPVRLRAWSCATRMSHRHGLRA